MTKMPPGKMNRDRYQVLRMGVLRGWKVSKGTMG
jgi:hypothetical protein